MGQSPNISSILSFKKSYWLLVSFSDLKQGPMLWYVFLSFSLYRPFLSGWFLLKSYIITKTKAFYGSSYPPPIHSFPNPSIAQHFQSLFPQSVNNYSSDWLCCPRHTFPLTNWLFHIQSFDSLPYDKLHWSSFHILFDGFNLLIICWEFLLTHVYEWY